jgi:hypothetical protein
MSYEYRPLQRIQFDSLFGGRLEPYGIRAEFGPEQGVLSTSEGQYLIATRAGSSTHFEFRNQAKPVNIFRALETEFGAEFVDENDYRFWGFSSLEAMISGEGSITVFSYTPNGRWVMVEGPDPEDAEFTVGWLQAAVEANRLWKEQAATAPDAGELWARLCKYNPIYEVADQRPDLDFAKAAMVFTRKWLKGRAGFILNVSGSRWPEIFCLLVLAGFFVPTGDRYQMTIPSVIDVRRVLGDLADWLNRPNQENFNPKDLLLTLTELDAKSWEARLRHMDNAERLADRATLLADSRV